MKKIIELYKRIPELVKRISFGIILTVLLIISAMPIVAWIAGIAGLLILILQIMIQIREAKLNPSSAKTPQTKERNFQWILQSLWKSGYSRMAIYIFILGIVLHVSCRIHSQMLINQLYNEALDEKKVIITNIEKK